MSVDEDLLHLHLVATVVHDMSGVGGKPGSIVILSVNNSLLR